MPSKPLTRIRNYVLLLIALVSGAPHPGLCQGQPDSAATSFEALPILSYDTDTGFGYGAKVFLLNFLGGDESLDAVAFQSSKGERWYRVVVSVPDFEVRQGTLYALAVDLVVDYDRWIAYNYFGIGNGARFDDRQTFTREPLEVTLLFSRGFRETFVAQIGLRGRRIVNSGLLPAAGMIGPGGSAENGGISTIGAVFSGRYDSRDGYIAPSRGTVAQLECEVVPQWLWSTVHYVRWNLWVQQYRPVDLFRSVLAFRVGMESVTGGNLPMQVLVALGGSSNLRGSVVGRFVDRAGATANCEWRIPVLWRFGAVLGIDAGKVWSAPGKFDLRSWAINPIAGLRFSMETFVVRADVGLGKESTGFFLNFGHLF
jgi:outer membrane protein assembly factor BamA